MTTSHLAPSTSMQVLQRLTSAMDEKMRNAFSRQVVAVVGAGASRPSGFPLGSELKDEFRQRFHGNAHGGSEIAKLFEEEVRSYWGMMGRDSLHPFRRIMREISAFDLARALSSTEYGRRIIREAIGARLQRPVCRPLAYELLAHLAKHRYLDHFLVLNYDDLLDESIYDELSARRQVIVSSNDIPTNRSERVQDPCYVVHPFGRLGEGPYSITQDEVTEFRAPIRHFIEREVFGSDPGVPLWLLVVGYAAVEPAFAKLLQSQSTIRRDVRIIDIDASDVLPPGLEDVAKRLGFPIEHIALEADDAFEILLSLLKLRAESQGDPVWIPGARHKLISKCASRAALEPDRRFKLEIMLQGTKSRGFVHLEAFSQIPRFRRYAGGHAREILDDLLERDVLRRDEWLPDGDRNATGTGKDFVPNYMLAARAAIAKEFLDTCEHEPTDTVMRWDTKTADGMASASRKQINIEAYVLELLQRIEEAPDIEVESSVATESGWMLGGKKAQISSMRTLAEHTTMLLDEAIRSRKPVRICGIWATGEWLFGESAWPLGKQKQLLDRIERSDLPTELCVVISRAGGLVGPRAEQRAKVVSRLWNLKERARSGSRVEVRWHNWWEMNRVLTLIEAGGDSKAIYMRRRLGRPVVAPYRVYGEPGTSYLREVWDRYWARSHPIALSDVNALRAEFGIEERAGTQTGRPRRRDRSPGARRGPPQSRHDPPAG